MYSTKSEQAAQGEIGNLGCQETKIFGPQFWAKLTNLLFI